MTDHQIAMYWPNGMLFDHWAVHAEADPEEEWQNTIENLKPDETAVRFVNGIEVDRFHNDPLFT